MGYLGIDPLGKHQEGIIEPIKLQTKSTNDKIGLGYHLNKPTWQKRKSYRPCKIPEEVNKQKT